MNLLQRFFSRKRHSRYEPVLFGGVSSVDPLGLMEGMLELAEDVEKAAGSSNPRLKYQVLARVEETLARCQQFVELGDCTYQQIGPRTLVRVDNSIRQDMASRMIPFLLDMKKRLSQ